MQKHDKMVALAKEKSAEMTETAITAIETMYRKNIKISVAELTKLTGLSRGFFYNNPNVKQVMMELKEKQQGMILRNPKSGISDQHHIGKDCHAGQNTVSFLLLHYQQQRYCN